jgi:hypothetical protein
VPRLLIYAPLARDDLADFQPSPTPIVSAAMVDAAAQVLEESGQVEYWSGGPMMLVIKEMLTAAWLAREEASDGTQSDAGEAPQKP